MLGDLVGAGELQVGPGWDAFGDPVSYLHYAVILLLATLSGALLAYHPIHRRRPMRVSDLEQQKTLIIYSVVGAMIALICTVSPSMAFVIFGIGGLMRFRTDLGASKSTGHTIMSTLVGLCWGLGLQLVAVFATAYFWLMIYWLERATVLELTVGGVGVGDMAKATEAYRGALGRAGAQLTAHRKNFKKQEMTFVFRLPRQVALEGVVREVETIPETLRGVPDWPE